MKKFTIGFAIILNFLNIISIVGLFFYSNHINDRLYDFQEDVDDLNIHFSVKDFNDQKKETLFNRELSDVQQDLNKKTEQISIIEESVDFKNVRWAKIKRVRKAVTDTINGENLKNTPNVIGLTSYAAAVVDYSERYDVSVSLILAVSRRESAFNQYAESSAKARGFMQLIDSTAEECAADLNINHYNIYKIDTNIQFGTWYLRKMLDFFGNNTALAVRAYNCGPACVKRVLSGEWRDYPSETRAYVDAVLGYKKQYENLGF